MGACPSNRRVAIPARAGNFWHASSSGGASVPDADGTVLLQSELDKGAFGVKDTMAPFFGGCLCPVPPPSQLHRKPKDRYLERGRAWAVSGGLTARRAALHTCNILLF